VYFQLAYKYAFLVENIVVAKIVYEGVKKYIKATTSQIAESLRTEQPLKRRIEKVNKPKNDIS